MSRTTVTALLAPLDLATFLREHFERAPALVRRAGRELPGLDTLRELPDRMLSERALRRPDVRVALDGEELTFDRLCAGSRIPRPPDQQLADPAKLIDCLELGATLIVQGTQHQSYEVAELVRDFERCFPTNGFVDANLFVTRRATPGLPEHYDNEDLFVLQLAGTKTWTLREAPLPLPLPEQTFERSSLGELAAVAPGTVTLEPGDLLYVPRGVVHRVTSGVGGSVHLTVGFAVNTWRDALVRTLEAQALEREELREAVPIEWLEAADDAPLIDGVLARLRATDLVEPIVRTRDELAAEALSERRALLRGQLAELEQLAALGADATLAPRTEQDGRVWNTAAGVRVQVGGRALDLPAHAEPALRSMLGGGRFRIGDVGGGLDTAGRTALARALVREGILRVLDVGTGGAR
ncbi:MAG: hypothetical protein IPM29_15960 [Planctomycetes bacterium]|nr:hypothetical protein [Planctomycetota bacterium]